MTNRLGVSASLLCAAMASLVSTGCSNRPVTEVVVVVRTTYAVPTALDGVRIEARRAGGAIQMSEGAWMVASEPRILGLVHDGGALGPIDVSVVGMLGPDEIVTRDASFSFVEGEIRRVELWLVPECATGVSTCRGSETCDPGGVCRTTTVAPGELLPWTGSVDGVDAGMGASTDSGTSPDGGDAGVGPPDAARFDAATCCPIGSLPHVASTSCESGTCVLTCESPWGDCSAELGCETRLTRDTNCGRCGRACTGGESCQESGGSYQCR
ncbi:MAG: hypothetical protein U0353_23970 [Sandaracinus sp.]